MRREVVLAGTLWVAVFLTLVSGCASFSPMGDRPRVYVDIVNIIPKDMRLMEQTFVAELRIQNPMETDLDINGVALDIEINGQSFAKGVSNQNIKVERLSTRVIQVEAYTGLTSILRQLAEVRKGSYTSGFKYRLKGTVYAGSPPLPIHFDETGEIK